LSLAVGFTMIASYLLSSTFVPVMCVWILNPKEKGKRKKEKEEATEPEDQRPAKNETGQERQTLRPFSFFLFPFSFLFRFPWQHHYENLVRRVVQSRGPVMGITLGVCCLFLLLGWWLLGTEIFPRVDAGQFRMKIKAPAGSHIETTEKVTKNVLN